MRISELSRVSGVPVPTVKFYLREGLLSEGVRTSPNQAQYDDSHLQRLRLIRALVGAGGLSLATTREVLRQVDDALAALAMAVTALAEAGFEIPVDTFDTYADAMMQVAQAEIARIPTESADAAVRYVELGTVLAEPVLLALRRLAQREASAARFPPSSEQP